MSRVSQIDSIVKKFPVELADCVIPPVEILDEKWYINFDGVEITKLLQMAVDICKENPRFYGHNDCLVLEKVLKSSIVDFLESDHERLLQIAEIILSHNNDDENRLEEKISQVPNKLVTWAIDIINNKYINNPRDFFDSYIERIDDVYQPIGMSGAEFLNIRNSAISEITSIWNMYVANNLKSLRV